MVSTEIHGRFVQARNESSEINIPKTLAGMHISVNLQANNCKLRNI
jgi:hypothetical protein